MDHALLGGSAILAVVILAIGLAAAPIAKHPSRIASMILGVPSVSSRGGGPGGGVPTTESRHRLVGELQETVFLISFPPLSFSFLCSFGSFRLCTNFTPWFT